MNFDEVIKRVTVKTRCQGIVGTGVLYCPDNSDDCFVITAKHNILGIRFTGTATTADFSFTPWNHSPENEVAYTMSREDKFVRSPDQSLDLFAIQVDKKKVGKMAGEIPSLRLATINEYDTDVTFRGHPRYNSGSLKTMEGHIQLADYISALFPIHVPVNFTDFIGSLPGENVQGFSGGGVFSGSNDITYLHGILTDYQAVDSRFIAVDAISILKLLGNMGKYPIYDPWVERLFSREKEEECLSKSAKMLGPRFTLDNFPVALDRHLQIMGRDILFIEDLNINLQPLNDDVRDFAAWSDRHGRNFYLRFGRGFLTPGKYRQIAKKTNLQTAMPVFMDDLSKLSARLDTCEFQSPAPIDFSVLTRDIEIIRTKSQIFLDYISTRFFVSGIPEPHYKDALTSALQMFARLRSTTEKLSGYLSMIEPYYNTPFLMVKGKAGNGKSQLLANTATMCYKNRNPVVLVLGQQLRGYEDPDAQILLDLGLSCDWKTFLIALDRRAAFEGKTAFIFIDALNEGNGLRLWNNHLERFIRTLDGCGNIKLCMSYRSSFEVALFDGLNLPEHEVIEHQGFLGHEAAAMNYFFGVWNIKLKLDRPWDEFSSPLFLRLFCLAYSRVTDSQGLTFSRGILFIFKRFIEYVNEILARPSHYDYRSERLNLVQKGVDSYLEQIIKPNDPALEYEKAYTAIDEKVGPFLSKKGFVDGMIDEEIFYEDLRKDEDRQTLVLDFSYQKFGDHLIIKHLLRDVSGDDLESVLSATGQIGQLLNTVEKRSENSNLLEALTIQVSDKYGVDLVEVAHFYRQDPGVVIAYIMGLTETTTRKPLTPQRKQFVIDFILVDENYRPLFFSQMLSLCDNDSPFNAKFLHEYLSPFSMAERDKVWTSFLHAQYDEVNDGTPVHAVLNKLVAIVPEKQLPPDEVHLLGTAAAWFLVSTNRRLRDRATKALVWLYAGRLYELAELMEKFRNIDDPYLQQRLYAVAFGALTRSPDAMGIEKVCDFIFETVFSSSTVVPDLLLRDYARSSLEYGLMNGWEFDGDQEQFRPPYASEPFHIFPDDEQVDSRLNLDSKGDFTSARRSIQAILSSMVTEYGRGNSGYGDFGRYVFEATVKHWRSVKANDLGNLAVEIIFSKLKYDPYGHGELDAEEEAGRTKRYPYRERIGKKYQWIAFFEILARLADHEKFYKDYSEKKTAVYNGPWDLFIRDIDPTTVSFPTYLFSLTDRNRQWFDFPLYKNWEATGSEWIDDQTNWPDAQTLCTMKDDMGVEWLVLHAYPTWRGADSSGEKTQKRMDLHLKSFIISKKERRSVINMLTENESWPYELHQPASTSTLYSKEFYWSPAYQHLEANLEKRLELIGVNANKTRKCQLTRTAIEYAWHAEYDNSLERDLTLFKPSSKLLDLLKLIPGDNEGEWVNKAGQLVCFDPAERYNREPVLLVRRNDLFTALKRDGLTLIWTIYGEKRLIRKSNYEAFQGIKLVSELTENMIKTDRSILFEQE